MNLLGFDIETTGLDPKENDVLEIGMAVWDTKLATPLALYSHLFRHTVPEKITEITGITQEMSDTFGETGYFSLMDTLSYLLSVGGFEAFVGHNAHRFDIPFLREQFLKEGEDDLAEVFKHFPVIDTRYDLPVAEKLSGKNKTLQSLAEIHDIKNPFEHRALTDVLTMMLVVQKYNVQKIIDEILPSPLVYITYIHRFPGAYWWPEEKLWRMAVRECYFDQETAALLALEQPIAKEKIKKMTIPEGED